jgi:hypothetical protein
MVDCRHFGRSSWSLWGVTMTNKEDAAALSQTALERLNSIVITVVWQDSLGHPSFRPESVAPAPPWTFANFFRIKLFALEAVKTGNPDSPATFNFVKIPVLLSEQKIRQYGESEIVDGDRTVSFLASANWSYYKEFCVSLGFGPDTVWVNGPAMGNRTMSFEARSDRHVSNQADAALAIVVLTPGEMSKGHTEFAGIAQ